jgi:hypothetical protein
MPSLEKIDYSLPTGGVKSWKLKVESWVLSSLRSQIKFFGTAQ